MPSKRPSTRVAATGLAIVAIAAAGAATALLRDETPPTPGPATGSGTAATTLAGSSARRVVQAENLAVRPQVGQPVPEDDAGGGRAMQLFADGAVSARIEGPIDRPVLRVRGDQCDGPPQMRVRVNGEKVMAMPVSDEQWRTVVLDVPESTAPANVISVAFFDDFGRPGCDRNLRVDWIAPDAAAADRALAGDDAGAAGDDAGADPDPLHADGRQDRDGAPTPTPAPAADDRDGASPDAGEAPSPDGDGDTARGGASSAGLFVDPNSAAARYARQLRDRSGDRAARREAALIDRIAARPQATWLGDWDGNVGRTAGAVLTKAAGQRARPVFVAYAIPGRDCGSYSAGGLPADRYRDWISDLARGIGSRPALVVLEPDALAQADCLTPAARSERFRLLRHAVTELAALSATSVYLDAGHSGWKPADEMADRLRSAGITGADGFALNTSNYGRTADEVRYGRALSAQLGGKRFVIDTSRNGNGPAGAQWCNPKGRALGEAPTTRTGVQGVDAFLWIKRPGESDGTCNGGPDAGRFWPAAALELARNAR